MLTLWKVPLVALEMLAGKARLTRRRSLRSRTVKILFAAKSKQYEKVVILKLFIQAIDAITDNEYEVTTSFRNLIYFLI